MYKHVFGMYKSLYPSGTLMILLIGPFTSEVLYPCSALVTDLLPNQLTTPLETHQLLQDLVLIQFTYFVFNRSNNIF